MRCPLRPAHLDGGVERNQRDREVRGVGGDAMLARAEHGMPAVLAADRGAAGARRALVAGGVADIAEIRAAGALQEVAAHRRLVAHLRARRVQQRLGDDGKLLDHRRVRGHLRHRGGGADPEALRSGLDAVVEKAREADQPLGPANVFLEKLHHIGAAGDVFGGRVVAAGLGAQGEGGGEVARAFEGEGVHGSTSPHRTGGASRVLDGRDDVVVGAAAAQIAAHPVANFLRASRRGPRRCRRRRP